MVTSISRTSGPEYIPNYLMEKSQKVIYPQALIPNFTVLSTELSVMTGHYTCLEQAFYTGHF